MRTVLRCRKAVVVMQDTEGRTFMMSWNWPESFTLDIIPPEPDDLFGRVPDGPPGLRVEVSGVGEYLVAQDFEAAMHEAKNRWGARPPAVEEIGP